LERIKNRKPSFPHDRPQPDHLTLSRRFSPYRRSEPLPKFDPNREDDDDDDDDDDEIELIGSRIGAFESERDLYGNLLTPQEKEQRARYRQREAAGGGVERDNTGSIQTQTQTPSRGARAGGKGVRQEQRGTQDSAHRTTSRHDAQAAEVIELKSSSSSEEEESPVTRGRVQIGTYQTSGEKVVANLTGNGSLNIRCVQVRGGGTVALPRAWFPGVELSGGVREDLKRRRILKGDGNEAVEEWMIKRWLLRLREEKEKEKGRG